MEALQPRPRITIKEGVYSDWSNWRKLDETEGLDSPDLFRPRLEDKAARRVGRILERAKSRQPPNRPFVLVKVRKAEEKGSDVNLATDLLKDAVGTSGCRTALVVTNDSDLAYPLEMVREFGVRVILVNPSLRPNRQEAKGLHRVPALHRIQLEPSHLQATQRVSSNVPAPVARAFRSRASPTAAAVSPSGFCPRTRPAVGDCRAQRG